MGLEDNFHQAIEEWIEHCSNPHIQVSSITEPVRDCDAYRKIVSMGYEALPLIRQVYNKDSTSNFALSIVQGHGLVSLVKTIVGGDFSIPNGIRGRISAMENYTKNWLDKNMHKYTPTQ